MNSRLTVDIPQELHKVLKIEAIAEGVNMKTLVVEAMMFYLSKKPNRETLETFKKTDKGEELEEIFDIKQYFSDMKKSVEMEHLVTK